MTTTDVEARARDLADAIIAALTPVPAEPWPMGWPQSLAKGPLGVALVHIGRAGVAARDVARMWLAAATRERTSIGPNACLYVGAPAFAFVLHTAHADRSSYAAALDMLDEGIAGLVRRRVAAAHIRIDGGRLPALAEFDVVYGLAGLGGHLLRRDPRGEPLRDILTCLVRLTEPITLDGETVPGWWSDRAPSGRHSPDFPHGHANFGMAHGISGPLALLSLALCHGVAVPGHVAAISRICVWLDHWRQADPAGAWWPYWVTRDETRVGRPTRSGPGRPSWCYGTPGIARAQQLAALALGDTQRQLRAERALVDCFTDPKQLAMLDTTVCHGWAGLAAIARRCAADARLPELREVLPGIRDRLVALIGRDPVVAVGPGTDMGVLEGAAGIALALDDIGRSRAGEPGWDACLLIA